MEQGVSYYLTFKWNFVLIACVIAIFPTILIRWLLTKFGQIDLEFGRVFFVFWCISFATLIYDCKIPGEYIDRIKGKEKN